MTAEIEELETRVADMEGQLADPALFADPVQGKKIMSSYESAKKKLDEKTTWWEELAEAITERDLSL